MGRTRTGRRGRRLGMVVSAGLVLLLGVIGLLATRSAGQQAVDVHTRDRLLLEQLLGSLTGQTVYSSWSQVKDLAETQPARFPATPGTGTPEVRARLEALADRASLDAGVVVLDGAGQVTALWSPGGTPVDPADPGFGPLRRVAEGKAEGLPVSGVVTSAGEPTTALGVPVTLADGSKGLLVGLWHPRTSSMQTYNAKLSAEHEGDGWVVDDRGLVVVGPSPDTVGRPLPYRYAFAAIGDAPGTSGVTETDEDGVARVTAWQHVPGTTWSVLATQTRAEFRGDLDAGRRRVQLAVVALLLVAGASIVALHRKREAAVQALARTDELTSILNRRGWFAEAERELALAERAGDERVLLFVDLDGLKQVNDVLGHREGDRAIDAAARVLEACCRSGDLAGRLGGDEFVLLLGGGVGPDEARGRVHQALATFNASSDAAFELRLSVGSEVWTPGSDEPLEALVRRADLRMYADKQARPDRKRGLLRVPQPA